MEKVVNKLTELTANQDRCNFEASFPAVYEKNGRIVIIGKEVNLADLSHRVGPGEAVIEIDAGILERALAVRRETISGEPQVDFVSEWKG
jgi:hypothetical protein